MKSEPIIVFQDEADDDTAKLDDDSGMPPAFAMSPFMHSDAILEPTRQVAAASSVVVDDNDELLEDLRIELQVTQEELDRAMDSIKSLKVEVVNLEQDNQEYEKEYSRIQAERLQMSADYVAKCTSLKDIGSRYIKLKFSLAEKTEEATLLNTALENAKLGEDEWKQKY